MLSSLFNYEKLPRLSPFITKYNCGLWYMKFVVYFVISHWAWLDGWCPWWWYQVDLMSWQWIINKHSWHRCACVFLVLLLLRLTILLGNKSGILIKLKLTLQVIVLLFLNMLLISFDHRFPRTLWSICLCIYVGISTKQK